jgi:hypothetical protein
MAIIKAKIGARPMPLDPIKLRELNEKFDTLMKRFDEFTARSARKDAEKAQRKADKARRDAERLEPSEIALNASMPEAPPDKLPEPRDLPDLWYLDTEREELRQGSLSKSN